MGEGEIFRGEGILAITKALLQSGVSYVGGYQGSPISHLMDVLSDANELLDELDVHFESSASEASAAAMLSASVMYPLRGAVTWKSTAGTNVASDALTNLASGGVTGGALIILGEDFGEGSSIPQERSHAFAMKSQMWLLDPRPNLEALVNAVEQGFVLSEASNTPVMMQVRIRACHVHGEFVAKDNRPPEFKLRDALKSPRRDINRVVLPPASLAQDVEKLEQRFPAAIRHIRDHKLNEFFGPAAGEVGIVVQGGLYNSLMRALLYLGLANAYGETSVPIYVMNVTYPMVDEEIVDFCRDKRAVMMVEEGHPNYIEQSLISVLHRHELATRVHGKDMLPMGGDYTAAVVEKGLRAFFQKNAAVMLGNQPPAPDPVPILTSEPVKKLVDVVPPRPAGFCTGCPERPIFAAMKLTEKDVGQHHVSGDIGCHIFANLAPFNVSGNTMGYGLSGAGASAFNVKAEKRTISVMGDGGFWHNGLTSSIGNAVYNEHDGVIIIVDNHYAAATGGQDILSSRADNPRRSTQHSIATAVKGIGVKWVRQIDRTYDVAKMRKTLTEALTTDESGPKVIIASSECMLNKQRRLKPQFRDAVKAGRRVVKERFGVDEDVCTGDHACIRLSGCPSLSVKQSDDPLKDDPVATIDNSCVGCGNCGEVSEAAVLCPSFYRADVIHNPTRWDRLAAQIRKTVIGALQGRAENRRIAFPDLGAK